MRGAAAMRMGLLAAALVAGLAVRWITPADVADLRPRPDAVEYEEVARNVLRGEGWWLVVDGQRMPSRFPPGFAALLLPAMALDAQPGTGVRVVLLAAVAGIAATAAVAATAGGWPAAIAAAWLLALAPLHARWSQAVMSDVPAATAVTLLALAALRAFDTGGARRWFALGVGVGLGTLLRAPVGLVGVPLALLVLRTPGRLAALAAGTAAGCVPGALFAWHQLGSPLATAYDLWVPGTTFFAWRNVLAPPPFGGTTGNGPFLAAAFSGLGTLYAWPVAALLVVATVLAVRRRGPLGRLAVVALGYAVAVASLHALYFWQWDRYLLPALPLLLALAATPVGPGATRGTRAAAAGLVAGALAWPLPSAAPFAPPDKPLHEAAGLRALDALLEPDAALLARTHTALVDRLLRTHGDRVFIPLGVDEHQLVARIRRLPSHGAAHDAQAWVRPALDPQRPAAGLDAVAAALAEGRAVWVVLPQRRGALPGAETLEATLAARFRLDVVPAPGLERLRRIAPR